MVKSDIKSMLLQELECYFETIGERSYRAEQVFRWLHKGAVRFQDMTNLPQSLRERLESEFFITPLVIANRQISTSDNTIKHLWRLSDGNSIESVLMDYKHGTTVCISTQVGCAMGCVFCASAIGGFIRNLTPSEMLDQILCSQQDTGKQISNVVLMGIGEPLDNFNNTMKFIKLINHPSGLNIGARHITISTCGLTENIDKLSGYDIQLSLAASLHAPDDKTRSRLMPINNIHNVGELLGACDRFYKKTGRRVTFEYALIDGINDTAQHAQMLAERLKDTGSHINLIMLNEPAASEYRASTAANVKAFESILHQKGLNCTIRRRLGIDIDAACGQLRRRTGV